MPSLREAWGIFLGVAVAVVVIVVVFVYPGQPSVQCAADVWIPENTIPVTTGHWYCSEIVVPQAPRGCGTGAEMVNGTAITTYFGGYDFSVHLFASCLGTSNLGLNASVIRPAGSVFNVTVSYGTVYWTEWHNWTSPQNDTGFQWQPNLSEAGHLGWNVSLLIAGD